ncbi:unnamed protein product [Adineta ricciae]|uniref:Uncharacterized protein n=1 Tax=Adineta ricciae TaxID=249248 RepID=A0A814XYA7_ADIRI|nr:unnamed protein product [Adineta ricciae]CAF1367772.1 unnamed protein product [Adineta ricciae]
MNTNSGQNINLADRLNRRRQRRIENGLGKSSESLDITMIKNNSTVSRSPERTPSKQTNHSVTLKSSAKIKRQETLPADDMDKKQNPEITEKKVHPTLAKEQAIKSHSMEAVIEREKPAQTLHTVKKQTSSFDQIVSSTTSTETSERTEPVQQETIQHNLPPIISPRKTKLHQSDESIIDKSSSSHPDKEPCLPKLPPIIIPRSSHISNPFQANNREHPIPACINDFSQSSLDYPASDPPNTTESGQISFDFLSTSSLSKARSMSEQIVSKSEHRIATTHARFVKQNSLALSYVFSKHIINTEFTRTSSLNSEQVELKTVWD